jgi:hypothetical protein
MVLALSLGSQSLTIADVVWIPPNTQASSELAPAEETAMVYGAAKAARRLGKKSGELGLGPLTESQAAAIHVYELNFSAPSESVVLTGVCHHCRANRALNTK